MRLEPHAIGRLAARLERGSAVISATNGKTTTAAMAAGILERAGARLVHNRAGANMAGGVAAALMGGPPDGDTGLFEVDEFWLGQVVDELRPRALLLANLFRDQLDRYGELDSIADRWAAVAASTPAALVLNADDPTVADLGRERVRPPPTSGSRTTRWPCRRCSTPPTPRTAGAAARPTATTPSTSAISGATTATAAGPRAPTRRSAPAASSSRACASARFTLRTPAGERAIALPLPGLYNVYNALGAAALALALGATLDHVDAGLHAVSPAFGRAETLRIAGRELSILLVKNPAGANEVLRTLTLEDGEHDVFAVLNDNIADGRDVSWVWDADFEVLAPRVRRATCSGTRAAEMALRLKYAGVPTERIAVEPDLGGGPRPTPCARATAGSSPCPPTPRCWRCATCCVDARRRAGLVHVTDGPLARHRVRRLRPRPAAVARAGRPRGLAGPRRRRGHRARGARPRAPRPRGRRARPRRGAARRPARARRGPARSAPSQPTRATFASTAASRSIIVPMQTLQLLGGADGPRALPAPARARTWRPAGCSPSALADALECFDEEHDQPPPPDLREVGGVVYASRPVARARPRRPRGHRARARDRCASTAPSRTLDNVIELDRLEARGARAPRRSRSACAPSRRGAIPQTLEYVGSTVVMLRG